MALGFGKDIELYGQAPGGGVRLRSPKWADFEDWANLRRENEEFLTPWEPEWDPNHLNRNSYKTRLGALKRMAQDGRGQAFHIFRDSDNRLIGACNITQVQGHPAHSADLGYWIGQNYSRQGYARAAVRAAIRFCFDELGLHRIQAAVQPSNTPSVNLLEAVGFTREGTARGYLKINGQWRDHDIYARLSGD